MTETSSVYEAAGGEAGMHALAQAWHERALVDEVVGHAFSHGFDEHHAERLAAYLGEALGGPPVFSTRYGDESAVERMHAGNGAHPEMDDRAVGCFDQALDDVGVEPGTRLRSVLHDYFAWSTRTTMAGHPDSPDDVPAGLSIPHWSWDGLVRA
ncbi:MAG: hypothetical protein ACRYG2_31100 [Janthinobacterium lividum]